MNARMRRAGSAALLVVPLAAFMVGPLIGRVVRDAFSDFLLYTWLPFVLTPTALGLVLVFVFARTRSAARVIAFAGGSLVIVPFGAFVHLMAVWPRENRETSPRRKKAT
jgi:ABC-type molybdate transport system permease subunit